jgi:hypothetical protein
MIRGHGTRMAEHEINIDRFGGSSLASVGPSSCNDAHGKANAQIFHFSGYRIRPKRISCWII